MTMVSDKAPASSPIALEDREELPNYYSRASVASQASSTSQSRRAEHVYSLENSKGKKWVTLLVKSRSPTPKVPPLFIERDVIQGRVEVDLDKPEAIKAITISVRAGTTAVGQDEIVFLELTKDIWNASVGNSGSTNPKQKFDGKLNGKHSWSYVFSLPRDVTIPGLVKRDTFALPVKYRLPPTFSERSSPAYIDYRLIVTVKRGAFRVDQVLSTNFGYQPATFPDPPSPLRILAYRENTGLIDPEGDPEGWKSLDPVVVKGRLFDTRDVEVKCTLSIATPLCYTLGAPIPLFLSLESSDEQALDVLCAASSTASTIKLNLTRTIATGSDATIEDAPRSATTFYPQVAGSAVWWPSTVGSAESRKRVLQGELPITKTLKPSFVFPKFTVRYTLDLMPFEASGFEEDTDDPFEPLLSEKILLVTAQTPGVPPHRSIAPPGYVQQLHGNVNTTMGLLENGNQRFLHHGHNMTG